MSSRSCLFPVSSSPPRPVFLISSLVFDLYLLMRLVEWSLRLRTVTANSSQLIEIKGCILPYGSFFPTSKFTFKYTLARNFSHQMNVLYLIPRHDRPKEGGKQKISLQVFQNMATKDYTLRVKKSSVKWKCEKKNSSNLLLLWVIFLFFQRSLPFSCPAHNIKRDVLTFRI